ncbi:MAG TPA: hypothetical protein VFS31_13555 [Chitinophagaceae bacterium]|nr:hypothetical protein [Chitinophagaceae bacterium]
MSRYDVIIYAESKLQVQITKYLLEHVFRGRKVLVIIPDEQYRPATQADYECYLTRVNLHGYKKWFASLRATAPKALPDLSCSLFIASVLTGLNSLFWEQHIQYDRLGLLDDGTGTLFSLEFGRVFESRRVASVFRWHNLWSALSGKPGIEHSQQVRQRISAYFSVYHKRYDPFETTHIPLFGSEPDAAILEEYAFVGQPFVALGQLDKQDYYQMLESVSAELGQTLTYFPHPKEDKEQLKTAPFLSVMDGVSVEEYYKDKRPQRLLSVSSSVLINLSLRFDPSFINYVPVDMPRYPDIKKYHLLMERMGVKKISESNYVS